MNNNTRENTNEDVVTDDPGDVDESQAPEIIPIETKKAQHPAGNTKTLDELIDKLPDNFPDANAVLKENIFPQIIEMDAGMRDYYTVVLQKKFSVGKQTIKEAIKSFNQEMATAATANDNDLISDEEEEEIDPEIIERSEELALDPFLLKSQIDIINSLGIQNERLNIAMYCLTIHSRLNPLITKGAQTLALQ